MDKLPKKERRSDEQVGTGPTSNSGSPSTDGPRLIREKGKPGAGGTINQTTDTTKPPKESASKK